MTTRTRCPPSLSRGRELVSVSVNRTVMHSSRRLTLFFFRNLPGFMKTTKCGERTIPMLPSSPPNTGSRSRSSAGGNRLKISSRPLRSRVVRSSCVNACSSPWSLRLRTQHYTQLRCESRSVNRTVNRDTGLEMPCCPVTDLLWV